MSTTQNIVIAENDGTQEAVIAGVTVRIAFSESGSDEIPILVREILKAAYLRCQL